MAMPTADEQYLSGAAVHDAAGALRALADMLLRVRGSFADDAVVEADQLRALADGLLEWWPPLSHGVDGGPHRAPVDGVARERHWSGLLEVYFRHALEPVGAGT